jgi:hypothetical protein
MRKKDELRASKEAIVKILTITQKTSTQLADDIGEDGGVVRQWVMKDNRKVPEEYRRRIAAFYGAEWDDDGELFEAGSGYRKKFSRKTFDDWRSILVSKWEDRAGFPKTPSYLTKKPNGEPYDKFALEGFLIAKASDTLHRILAAAENRRGTDNYRRLFAVIESFLHWQENVLGDFRLTNAKEIQALHSIIRSGIIESTNVRKYISMMRSVTAPPARSELDTLRHIGKA